MKVYLLYIQDYEDLRFFGIFKSIKRGVKEVRELIKEYDEFKEAIFSLDRFIVNRSYFKMKTKELFCLCFFGKKVNNNLTIRKCIKKLKQENKK